MWLFQSVADFFYLSWRLLRSLFMSQEALEQEIAEMRRQIAELKAEAAQADKEDKNAANSGRFLGDHAKRERIGGARRSAGELFVGTRFSSWLKALLLGPLRS
jgi:hypothetical protein